MKYGVLITLNPLAKQK